MEGLFSLIQKGGFAMYPLIVLSLVSWAIILERAVNLRPSLYLLKNMDQLRGLLASGDLESALKVLQLDSSRGSKILSHLLQLYRDGKREDITKELDLELSLLAVHLEKNLALLSTISSVAPLLGLFGTITGLIKVFSAFSITALEKGMTLLASGISEALIAAATGLAVAIPSLLAYWVFKIIANSIINRLEENLIQALRFLK